MGKKFLNKTNIANKLKDIGKYYWFYVVSFSVPFFLALTSYYIPFGASPIYESIINFESGYWDEMKDLLNYYPENILWVVLIFFVLYLIVPKKHWRWIGFTYLAITLWLLFIYGF